MSLVTELRQRLNRQRGPLGLRLINALTSAIEDDMIAAGEALLRCDLTVLTPDDLHPTMLGLFSSPGGSWLLRARWGLREPVVAEPVAVAAMRDAVAALVSGPGGDEAGQDDR